MMRFKTLALAFAPFALAAPVAVAAQSAAPLSQVQAHLMSHQYEGLLKKANFKGGAITPR